MTRKELAEKLAVECSASFKTVKDADAALKCAFVLIGMELVSGHEVSIDKFGIFKVVKLAERSGHNPRTGEEITIPAHKSVAFTPSKTLKDAVKIWKFDE